MPRARPICWAGVLLLGLGLVSCDQVPGEDPCFPDGNEVSYEVVFQGAWSEQSHPVDYPKSAHFSQLIGAAHASGYTMWDEGGTATSGFELMAETGAIGELSAEIDDALAAGTAGDRFSANDSVNSGTGRKRICLVASPEHRLVSLVTMIAPSPDWFVGIHGVDLRDGGGWREQVVVDLLPYDAGTGSGATYKSSNADVTPHEPIALLSGDPVEDVSGTVQPFATLTLTLE